MSPLHHNPITDGDYWGCLTEKANKKVARLVHNVRDSLASGMYDDWDEVLSDVKLGLQMAGNGATDTVVKESVFGNLEEDMRNAGIEPELDDIYGW